MAGLALIGAITASLAGVIGAEDHREASTIPFFTAASFVSFLGLGAAFGGILCGALACAVSFEEL